MNEEPTLGSRRAIISQHSYSPSFFVMVKEFKFDTIRQEAYWVQKQMKEFKTEKAAKAFAERVQNG